MNFTSFIERYPVARVLKRGEQRKVFSQTVSAEEYELLQKLAHHPNLREFYDGQLYAVTRHALLFYLYEMDDLVTNHDFKPALQRIKDETDVANRKLTGQVILDDLADKAEQLHFLMDDGEIGGAKIEFDKYLAKIKALPQYWINAYHRRIESHPEMQRFLQRMRDISEDEFFWVRGVLEKYMFEEEVATV